MKKIIVVALIFTILLAFGGCGKKYDKGFAIRVVNVEGDKYYAKLQVEIEREGKEPFKKMEYECDIDGVREAEFSHKLFFYEGNIATANFEISNFDGLDGKTIHIIFSKFTVDEVVYEGKWVLNYKVKATETSSKFYYLANSAANDKLFFNRIEATPYTMSFGGFILNESNGPRSIDFYKKDGTKLVSGSVKFGTSREDGSDKTEIRGTKTFLGKIDISDIGALEYNGKKYDLVDDLSKK